MPIYSSDAAELVKEFEAALAEQKQALAHLVVTFKDGTFADKAQAADLIEFHNNRVMRFDAALQPYRLDKSL